MEEYPRSLLELEAAFSTESACREYLARLRWPGGFRCPRGGGGKAWPVRGVLLECAACGGQTSVTAGTIFQDTRTPLPVWFRAMWWVATQKNGASALGLQRVLGLKSYETAWTWLHKLRRAMVRPGRDMLTGRIEVDECYVGGPEEGLPGRLNLREDVGDCGRAGGRTRDRQDSDAPDSRRLGGKADSLCARLRGSRQCRAYRRVAGILAFEQQGLSARDHFSEEKQEVRVRAASSCSSGHLAAETVAAGHPPGRGEPQTPRLLLGRIHVPFQPATRRSKSRGKVFFRLAQQAVAVDPVPLDQILHPSSKKT